MRDLAGTTCLYLLESLRDSREAHVVPDEGAPGADVLLAQHDLSTARALRVLAPGAPAPTTIVGSHMDLRLPSRVHDR